MGADTLTADQFGQIVEVVAWAIGFALIVLLVVAHGVEPWVRLGGFLRWLGAAAAARYVAIGEGVPESRTIEWEQRSDAAERDRERAGTEAGNVVPVAEIPEFLAQLDDATWVELLALIPGDKDGYRFADSQIAKFIPGRNAEWMQQIRELRDKPAPAPAPKREIPMRHMGQERKVAIE